MDLEKVSDKLGLRIQWLREFFAELTGTFILVFIGNCSVAQNTLVANGTMLSINLAYGLGVFIGVLIAGGVSGAHLNPAVTLAMCLVGKHPWKSVPHYFAAQYLGAFLSAVFTYLVYLDALYNFDSGVRQVSGTQATAGIFVTYPQNYLSPIGGILDQVLGTFTLLLAVCAICDRKNMAVPSHMVPLYVGLVVMAIGMALGANCGYAINPARDLGPRIFITIAGWGAEAFTYQNFWWIPIVGPHLGGILGALVYVFCLEIHHKKENDNS